MRQKALEGILDIIDTVNDDEIRKLITGFEQTNTNGEHEEFCSVIIYVLKKYL